MSLRPDTIRPPALIRKQTLGKVLTYRHDRTRRIYKASDHDVDRATVGIATRSGRRRRVITKERLLRDFSRVALCACGRHHSVARAQAHTSDFERTGG